MKKARVCHITTSHRSTDNRVFQRECRALAKSGFDVTLMARHPREEIIDGVRMLPLPSLNRLGHVFLLPKAAISEAAKLNADIYHFHDPGMLPWALSLARSRGAKVIWDAHELYSATIKQYYFKPLPFVSSALARVFDWVEKRCCAGFAGVVTVSEPLRDRYASWGARVVMARNMIDMNDLPPIKTPRTQGLYTLFTSGTLDESRRARIMFEAFAMFQRGAPNACLRVLAYFGSSYEEESVKRLIHESDLSGSVRIERAKPWTELMANETPHANVGLVLFSRCQNSLVTLPNRLFEYWSRGLPVIATDTPIMKKYVGANDAGLVVNTDSAEELADAYRYYYDNPDVAQRHGQNGYKLVSEKYNWNNEFNNLKALYDEILKR